MKNLLFPLILLLGVALLTTSCNDDEDDARANAADINGTTVTLTEAVTVTYGENYYEGSYDWDIFLTTEGLDIDITSGFSGIGSFVYLDLNTNSQGGLVSGTYNWGDIYERDAFTIVDGTVSINLDTSIETADYSMEAASGTVIVNVGESETEFDINLTMDDGEILTAYYKGALTPQ